MRVQRWGRNRPSRVNAAFSKGYQIAAESEREPMAIGLTRPLGEAWIGTLFLRLGVETS